MIKIRKQVHSKFSGKLCLFTSSMGAAADFADRKKSPLYACSTPYTDLLKITTPISKYAILRTDYICALAKNGVVDEDFVKYGYSGFGCWDISFCFHTDAPTFHPDGLGDESVGWDVVDETIPVELVAYTDNRGDSVICFSEEDGEPYYSDEMSIINKLDITARDDDMVYKKKMSPE